MKVTPVRTSVIRANQRTVFDVLDESIVSLPENTVVAISSKIISLCEGSVVNKTTSKDELIQREAELYLPRELSPYGYCNTITNHTLIAGCGIDSSNADGQYVLWPLDSQKTANQIREYLASKFNLTNIGVIITDSASTPLRLGVTGIFLGFSGFKPLQDNRGKKDLFGETMVISRTNIAGGIAAAAVLVMGESNEQTPIALVEDLQSIDFVNRNPNSEELETLNLDFATDVYGAALAGLPWKQGSRKN